MTTWRGACAGFALVLVLGGCAGGEEPPSIDGKVDIVPADDAKSLGDKVDAAGDGPGDHSNVDKGSDPSSDRPKSTKSQCAAAVASSNALLTEHVLALFPPTKLRAVQKMKPADTEQCDPAEGPDYGGVEALWKGMTGVQAIELLAKAGWKRHDPAQGPPVWVRQNLKPGDGTLNLDPNPKHVVTFTADRGGRQLWIDLTQDGMRAGIE